MIDAQSGVGRRDGLVSSDDHESFRIGHWQAAQNERVQDAENRCVRSNAKRQREKCRDSEPGTPAQGADGVADVANGRFDSIAEPRVSHLFFHLIKATGSSSAWRRASAGAMPSRILRSVISSR